MNISYFENAEVMSQKAAEHVLAAVRLNPFALLCTATGNSPTKLYENLGREYEKQEGLFQKVRVIPLDEWLGLSTSESSCHTYIAKHVLGPLQISPARYFGFNANAKVLDKECERIQNLLRQEGPIDICILGLGKNGHLGFNEPAVELQAHCHIAQLAAQSQEHTMLGNNVFKPTQGLTLGMQDILAAKKIILLVSGEDKEKAFNQLQSAAISNACPATWLWKHENVECLVVN